MSAPNPDDPLAENVAKHWKENEQEAVATGATLTLMPSFHLSPPHCVADTASSHCNSCMYSPGVDNAVRPARLMLGRKEDVLGAVGDLCERCSDRDVYCIWGPGAALRRQRLARNMNTTESE